MTEPFQDFVAGLKAHVVFIRTSNLPHVDYKVRFFTRHGEIKNYAHATIAAHWFLAKKASINQSQVIWQETPSYPSAI
jgi:predicted PhzF superfamily epimerase YddE/YHI9